LKIGAILYGSGYVLFAFLDAELVAKGLLSRATLIDAIVGQFTPGPVFHRSLLWDIIKRVLGALVSYNWNIFLPSFYLLPY
jgi:chromate transporter